MKRSLTLLMLLTGCASVMNDSQRAVALAQTCSTRHGVSGSPLVLDQPTVQRRSAREWMVSFSELAPRTFPSGRDLIVDLEKGSCAQALMD